MLHIYGTGPTFLRPDPDTILPVFQVQIWPDPACLELDHELVVGL